MIPLPWKNTITAAMVQQLIGLWWVVSGLMQCFLGYPLLRFWLLVFGAGVGGLAGVIGMNLIWPSAPGGAVLGVAVALAALLALMAWLAYRVVVALAVLAGIVAAAIFLSRSNPGAIVVAGVVGLALAVLVFVYTRPIVIALSAINGASGAIAGAAWVSAGPGPIERIVMHPFAHRPSVLIALAAVVVLAVVGVYVQALLVDRLGKALLAKPKAKAARPAGAATARAS